MERAVRAVRQTMRLAAEGHERAAVAHDDLARAQGEAAELEAASGSSARAIQRRRASRVAANEATAERVQAARFRTSAQQL